MDELNSRLKKMRMKGEYLRIDGNSIFYQIQGDGPVLLILHGYPFSTYDFKWVIPELAKQFKVVSFDLLGMGFSDKPEQFTYSFEAYASLTNQIAKLLNIKKAHIFAHDLGVSIAQQLIVSEQKNTFEIESIAFMNGGLFTDVYRPRLIQRLLSQTPAFVGRALSRKIGRQAIEKSVLSVMGPGFKATDELMDDFWSILNYREGKNIAYKLGRLVFEKQRYQKIWIEGMQKTSIPLVYICGPADPNSGRHMAQRYQELIPDPQVMMLSEDTGHWPQIEAPEQVVKSLLSFQNFK